MQILYVTNLSVSQTIEQRAWEQAKLERCPFHPKGGCGLAKHGTYARKFPAYCLIARWYCPKAHQSISLLPDFFACRFPGTLNDVEEAVDTAENSESLVQAASVIRPEITLASALRWLRRRIKYVFEILTILKGMMASKCSPVLNMWRRQYGTQHLLQRLRIQASDQLQAFPPILGLAPRPAFRYSTKLLSNNQWGLSAPL